MNNEGEAFLTGQWPARMTPPPYGAPVLAGPCGMSVALIVMGIISILVGLVFFAGVLNAAQSGWDKEITSSELGMALLALFPSLIVAVWCFGLAKIIELLRTIAAKPAGPAAQPASQPVSQPVPQTAHRPAPQTSPLPEPRAPQPPPVKRLDL